MGMNGRHDQMGTKELESDVFVQVAWELEAIKKSSENMKRNILGQWHGHFWLYVKMSENYFKILEVGKNVRSVLTIYQKW